MTFTVLDTGGLEDAASPDAIENKMLDHTRRAIQYADVVLFMIDAREGVKDDDVRFARYVGVPSFRVSHT